MNAQRLQLFLHFILIFAAVCFAGGSDLKIFAINFSDLDGNELSTADGHVTVLVFVTSATANNAQTVGDLIPDFCLGNPTYRMITVVEAKKHLKPIRLAFESIARGRLETAGRRLQARYDDHKITRPARKDVFAVIDYGGEISGKFADKIAISDFCIVILGPTGELRKEWMQLPTTQQLAAALK